MDIRVPQLAEGADLATVVNILVNPGDRVEKDQPVLELETAKAVGSVPSPCAGVISKVHVKLGDARVSMVESGDGPASEKPSAPARREEPKRKEVAPHVASACGPGVSRSRRKMAREAAMDPTDMPHVRTVLASGRNPNHRQ